MLLASPVESLTTRLLHPGYTRVYILREPAHMLIRSEGELHSLSAVVGVPPLEYISPAHLIKDSDELSWLVLVPKQDTLYQVHDGHPWR